MSQQNPTSGAALTPDDDTNSKTATELAEKYRTLSGDAKEEAYQLLEIYYYMWLEDTDKTDRFYNDIGGRDSELGQRFVNLTSETTIPYKEQKEEDEEDEEDDDTITFVVDESKKMINLVGLKPIVESAFGHIVELEVDSPLDDLKLLAIMKRDTDCPFDGNFFALSWVADDTPNAMTLAERQAVQYSNNLDSIAAYKSDETVSSMANELFATFECIRVSVKSECIYLREVEGVTHVYILPNSVGQVPQPSQPTQPTIDPVAETPQIESD